MANSNITVAPNWWRLYVLLQVKNCNVTLVVSYIKCVITVITRWGCRCLPQVHFVCTPDKLLLCVFGPRYTAPSGPGTLLGATLGQGIWDCTNSKTVRTLGHIIDFIWPFLQCGLQFTFAVQPSGSTFPDLGPVPDLFPKKAPKRVCIRPKKSV